MRKRPLCLAALVLTLALLVLPAELWMKTSPLPEGRGSPEFLSGEICAIDPGGEAVSLTHTNLSDTGIILVYFDAGTDFSIGNTIRIEKNFELKEPERPANPGQFDARLYYQTKDIVLFCYAEEAVLVRGAVRPVPQLFYRLRENFSARLNALFAEKYRGVIGAMLLGDKSELADETKEIYQKSGMSHLLAISGLHVSIFGMTLYRLLRRTGLPFWLSGIPSMLLVLAYGVLTGMSTSTARAVLMFLLSVTADLLGKSYDMLTSLAFAALCLLAEQPLYARSASYLLSFGAVLGIGLIYPALLELFPIRRKRFQAVLLSLSVQLMTLPMVESLYCEVPLYSVPLNLVVIPLMTLLMFSGIAALALSFLSFGAARLPALLCSVIMELYERLGSFTLRLPGSVLHCGKPQKWQLILYYACLAAFLLWRFRVREDRKKQIARAAALGEEEAEEEEKRPEPKLKVKRLCGAGGLALLNLLLLLRFSAGFQFTMLDVGQGESLFLRTKAGTTVLVDGGSTSVSKVGTYRILPFLKTEGVGRLDYVIATHVDSDHISGIEELLLQSVRPGNLKIGTLLLSEASLQDEKGQELAALARTSGTQVETVHAGMSLRDGSARLDCLYPYAGETYPDTNAASVTLKITCGELSILLTGDLGQEGEEEILEAAGMNANGGTEAAAGQKETALNCDILKAGHHGSSTSSSEEWLAAVSPALTLISCGKDNSYGHPHKETLKRLRAAGSQILVTTDHGALTVRSSGKGFRVEGFRQAAGGGDALGKEG